MFDIDKIKSYASKYAYAGPRSRGIALYKAQAVKSFKFSEDYKNITAKVKGTNIYNVYIDISQKNYLTENCDCPYDHGGICKHIVAVLYYLDDYLKRNPDVKEEITGKTQLKDTRKLRDANQPFEIENYDNITLSYISYNTKNAYSYDVRLQDIKENFISFKIFDWRDRGPKIEFEIKNNKLFTKCTCDEKIKGLCSHQSFLLRILTAKYRKDFFTKIESEYITKGFAKEARKYKLPKDIDYSDYFEISLSDKNIEFVPSGKAAGLIMPDSKNNLNLTKAIEQEFSPIQIFEKEENFSIGYVFLFKGRNSRRYIEIKPITGRLNKDKSKFINPVKGLNEYGSPEVQMSELDEKITSLCELTDSVYVEKYLNRYGLKYSRNETEVEFMISRHYSEIFTQMKNLLAGKKHIYTSDTEYLSSSRLKPVKVSDKPVKVHFSLSEDKVFYNFEPVITIGDKRVSSEDKNLKFHFPQVVEYYDTYYFLENVNDNFILDEYSENQNGIKITKNNFSFLFDEYIKPVSKHYHIDFKTKSIEINSITPEEMKKQLYISESGKFVLFKPFVLYDNDKQVNILQHGTMLNYEDGKITNHIRNLEFEKEYYEFFKSLNAKFKNQFNENFFHLEFDDFINDLWFLNSFEELKEKGVEIYGLKDLKNFKYSSHKARVNVGISSGIDWFDVNIELSFGGEQISLKDIQKAVMKQEKFVRLSDGTYGILPEEWLKKFEKFFRQGQVKKDELKISKLRFTVIDELFDEKDYSEIMLEVNEKKQRLKEFSEIKNVRNPQKLQGKLRDYQKAGYNWLNFLDEFKWGGILADDMGLGKTIQVLAFLLKASSKSKKANLIVVPTTLLFNWENELEKFAPSLNVLFHYGNNRAVETKDFKKYNLIVTSYGIMTRDIELLRKYRFNYIILDESQAIKNPNSQRFKATSLLKAENRIALTGTPIENNTFDLFAQMDFLNPGFLGSQKQFKENYSDAIDKNRNPIIAAELQNLINPFVLRRTKEQVAKELPPKTEDFIFCEMEKGQRKVYDAFRNKYRDMLLNKIEEEGLGKSKIYVMEGLMKLRQICDTPEILPDEENYGKESIKIKELIRHIKEKTGKHKILVFSQFVKMLSIIEREIKKAEISYEYLDGQSSKKARQESVENFQKDDNCRVFLISLKAGGTGLNLTAADYVYIVDPWWNPAVENQAIDRSHRIGQNKKVIAYRMICKDTIEEKIMKYQTKKQQIANEIIVTDDSFVKQLQKSDIEDLFA